MTRLNLLLLVALLLSSVYLVRVSYDARRLFGELDRAQSQHRQLETEYGQLQAERQIQATAERVEKTACSKLRMLPATSAITRAVTPPSPSSSSSLSSSNDATRQSPATGVNAASPDQP